MSNENKDNTEFITADEKYKIDLIKLAQGKDKAALFSLNFILGTIFIILSLLSSEGDFSFANTPIFYFLMGCFLTNIAMHEFLDKRINAILKIIKDDIQI